MLLTPFPAALLPLTATAIGLPAPPPDQPDHPSLHAARTEIAACAPRTRREAGLAAEALVLQAALLRTAALGFQPDLPFAMLIRLNQSLVALAKALRATHRELDRQQSQPLRSPAPQEFRRQDPVPSEPPARAPADPAASWPCPNLAGRTAGTAVTARPTASPEAASAWAALLEPRHCGKDPMHQDGPAAPTASQADAEPHHRDDTPGQTQPAEPGRPAPSRQTEKQDPAAPAVAAQRGQDPMQLKPPTRRAAAEERSLPAMPQIGGNDSMPSESPDPKIASHPLSDRVFTGDALARFTSRRLTAADDPLAVWAEAATAEDEDAELSQALG